MEPLLFMQTASVLLAISALGGLTMAVIRFGVKPQPPTWLAMLHGFLSAAALTLLLMPGSRSACQRSLAGQCCCS